MYEGVTMKNLICLLSFSFCVLIAFEAPIPIGQQWVMPLGQDSGVIFIQGADNTLAEAATYMVGSSFISPDTQEQISCDKGITIFKQVCVDPEFPEVVLASREPHDWLQTLMHPIEAYAENNNRKQYANSGIKITPQQNSSPTKTFSSYYIDSKKVTLGQMPDVQVQQQRVANFKIRFGNTPQIWHGQSRGAAVTFIAAALANRENLESLKTVKAIFLEGCYGSVASDLHTLTNSQFVINCAETYFSWWYSYKKNGINPLDVLKDFPKNIPTVFITSEADKQVPKAETDKLVSELVNAGHENIYYLVLRKSSHGNYVASDPEDARDYQAFSQAWYKELYLPYLPEYALAGAPLVAIAKKNAMAFKKR